VTVVRHEKLGTNLRYYVQGYKKSRRDQLPIDFRTGESAGPDVEQCILNILLSWETIGKLN
jgi:hypothetical protein